MTDKVDEFFYQRADAHINLSNDQLKDVTRGKASASMLYATARFNAWVSACGFSAASDMAEARQETVDYFVEQYKKMLEDNLDDYIQNFEKYIRVKQ